MHSNKTTFQVQENDGNTCKKFEHLCALRGRTNTCQHFPMDRWFQGVGGKIATVSACLFANINKKFQQAGVMWTNSGKTLQALAQWQLDFFSASLDKILYEFLLQSHYHKILHLLSCSIALLTRQSKSTVTIQSEFNGRDAGAQVVPTEAATLSRLVGIRKIHMLTFSIAFYICPCISHLRPNKSHLLYVYHTFLLL